MGLDIGHDLNTIAETSKNFLKVSLPWAHFVHSGLQNARLISYPFTCA